MRFIAIMLILATTGCASVYIINASPEATMERGDSPVGVRQSIERKTPPADSPQPTTPETR